MPEPERDEAEVRIPSDPTRREALADMARLTEEERNALNLWCADQAEEKDTRWAERAL